MAIARIEALNDRRRRGLHRRIGSEGIQPSPAKLAEYGYFDRSVTGVGWVRLASTVHNNADTMSNQPTHIFSPNFLEHASMAFSNAREQEDGYSGNDIELFATKLTRNKLHTVCAIAMILQKQYMEILVQNVGLPAWPKNPRQFYAARYRRGQILILHALIGSIMINLRRLIGLEPQGPREKRIVRLDHILKAGPKEFLLDFRAALHLGFGTRNAERIRQQKLVDSAFTLWLCGLWLLTSPAINARDQYLERPKLPARTADWISFIRDTYGEDSEVGRRWAAIPASEEGRSLAEGCHCIIRAAAARNPRSLFNCPEASFDRLLWCVRVILEESFMCPNLEGKIGEENDEVMLFLEDGACSVQTMNQNLRSP
ncbi:MAG: hypothetical protein Q9179_006081 [Wetmoreana sp. 5 TL-2023]